MKKIIHFICLFIMVSSSGFAQHKYDRNPCGSPPGKSAWLAKYQANPQQYQRGSDELIYVPLSIHLLGNDAGNGHFKVKSLLEALCGLNADFAESNIRFFIEGDIHYLNNSAWNSHPDVIAGGEMMFANNIENTINCYILNDPAGNCGYNLPYAGVALAEACTGLGSHTWAHEIGHNLALPHPFLGWEGGVHHDGSIPHNYNDPAPLEVLYDYTLFKDTLILDTLIIDTALVEFVNGSNCDPAADGFCDTPPDYLNYRWPCGSNNMSTVSQTDPDGTSFYSDGTLFMSYAYDECQDRFSPEEIEAMRANLFNEKADYLNNQTPAPEITDLPVLISPENDISVTETSVTLEWQAQEHATSYFVQVSRFPDFGFPFLETTVAETTLNVSGFTPGKTYYWRIKAFNSHAFCAPVSDFRTFHTEELTSTETAAETTGLYLYPNRVGPSGTVTLSFDSANTDVLKYEIYDSAGRKLSARETFPAGSGVELEVGYPAGVYWMKIVVGERQFIKKIIVL